MGPRALLERDWYGNLRHIGPWGPGPVDRAHRPVDRDHGGTSGPGPWGDQWTGPIGLGPLDQGPGPVDRAHGQGPGPAWDQWTGPRDRDQWAGPGPGTSEPGPLDRDQWTGTSSGGPGPGPVTSGQSPWGDQWMGPGPGTSGAAILDQNLDFFCPKIVQKAPPGPWGARGPLGGPISRIFLQFFVLFPPLWGPPIFPSILL